MSELWEFLTSDTAPWWVSLVSLIAGGLISLQATKSSEKRRALIDSAARREQYEREDTKVRREELRVDVLRSIELVETLRLECLSSSTNLHQVVSVKDIPYLNPDVAQKHIAIHQLPVEAIRTKFMLGSHTAMARALSPFIELSSDYWDLRNSQAGVDRWNDRFIDAQRTLVNAATQTYPDALTSLPNAATVRPKRRRPQRG